jgi:hypothetical protein
MNRILYTPTAEIVLELREQTVEIRGTIARAEPDVGIPVDYLDNYRIYDEQGNQLFWQLDDDEYDAMQEAFDEQCGR